MKDERKKDYLILKDNIKELIETYRVVHKSALKRGLRELFPFSLIFPGPRYESYLRLLARVEKELKRQRLFCKKKQYIGSKTAEFFYREMDEYIRLFTVSVSLLKEICTFRLQAEESGKINRHQLNSLLKSYNKSTAAYVARGPLLNEAFVKLSLEN